MDLENIKESTKQSIIQNFMENVKHARRGAQHQRPKSWSKGTKSGSDKKKMREQGKREARELHESPDWVSAAREAFQGYISPADVTTHFQNKKFSSVDHFKSAVQQLADDHADKFISTQARESQSPEKAMRAWSDKIVNKFDDQIAKQEKARTTNPLRNIGRTRSIPYDGTDAARDQRAVDRFEGRSGPGSWQDYYESIKHSLESRVLNEQTPMGWHEGDSELEGDKISKIETSLSPEERDPFHLVHPETREEINKTMREPHGHILGPAGMLGRIQSIADMALDTKSYGDDPDALKRISQLIHYARHAKKQYEQESSSYKDIPMGGPLKENTSKKSVNEEENLSLRDRSAKLRARARGDIWDQEGGAWIPAPEVNVRTQSSGQAPMKQAEAAKVPQPEMIKTLSDHKYISSEEPIKFRVTPAAHKRLQNLGFTEEQLGDSQEKIKIKDPLTTKLSNFLPFLKK